MSLVLKGFAQTHFENEATALEMGNFRLSR